VDVEVAKEEEKGEEEENEAHGCRYHQVNPNPPPILQQCPVADIDQGVI